MLQCLFFQVMHPHLAQAKQQVHHDDEAKHVGLMLEPNKAA